ncbi:hypothetical protein D9613_003024 [Agrocybe pediades]|uniref:Uncharacterized protein n=1 Tax=Agrocybe pediades TaxID=84607 RepID=A0A8H4VL09_9AGAR|nr:hypothetical protein D9613_003024 [Agrocybe pediades]
MSVKGSWTHCPNPDYVSKYLLSCTESLKLAETSAAFLHVLLLFVAISSRMRSVAMEIQEALVEIITSSRAILSAINTKPSQTDVTKLVSPVGEPMDIDKINVESELQSKPSASMEDEPLQEIVSQATTVASEHTTLPIMIPPPPVPIERETSIRNKETTRSKDGSTTSMTKKKKKRKAKNEIDDIFGF